MEDKCNRNFPYFDRNFSRYNGNLLLMFQMVVNEDGVHSLIITKASPLDAGVYTCLAENKGGQNSFNVTLRVLGK